MVDRKAMKTIVVSRFNEDVSWIGNIPERPCIRLYCKGEDVICDEYPHQKLPNIGRESHTYFSFICSNYHWLQGYVYFLQGWPFDHDVRMMEHIENPEVSEYGSILTCDKIGGPQVDWTPLHDYCRVLGLPLLSEYKFVQGAQFRLTAEQIKKRPVEFYRACLAITELPFSAQNENGDNISPWVFERLYDVIFGMNL